MITTRKLSRAKVRVTFELPDDGPSVGVAGDFNDWDPSTTPLKRRSGARRASVVLDTGQRYSFRYRNSDGDWFNDPQAHTYEWNAFGEENGIIDLA
jgi:1,4-alpha-glucan branching enzyme